MFHIGHLNLLRQAKNQCDYLIVVVNSDALVQKYKHKQPVICAEECREIIGSLNFVDKAVTVDA